MRSSRVLARALVAVTVSAVSLGAAPGFAASAHPSGATRATLSTASERGGPITREEIIRRTDAWVLLGMPYSREDFAPDGDGHEYRQDCSGFVSLALHAERSYSTRTIQEISTPISKDELRPGDYLNAENKHVVLFLGWANAERTRYHAREASNVKGGTLEREVPYPYYSNESLYVPMRYKNVVEGG